MHHGVVATVASTNEAQASAATRFRDPSGHAYMAMGLDEIRLVWT
jgi:hypothetical protein